MPNWCANRLFLEGNADDVTKLQARCRGEVTPSSGQPVSLPLSFAAFWPTPTDPETLAKESQGCFLLSLSFGEADVTPDWSTWRVHNWGTEWDLGVDTVVEDDSPGVWQLYFDTAWSPPIGAIARLVADFPGTARLEYYEMGMNFAGWTEWSAGEVSGEGDGTMEDFGFSIEVLASWEEDEADFAKEEAKLCTTPESS